MGERYVMCNDCYWEGYASELVSLTDDLDDTDFTHCPMCESGNVSDYDIDEE